MKKALWLTVAVAAGSLGNPGLAQDDDGPGRGVARISVVNGDVSVRRGDSGDWIAAAPNAPLVVGDRVFTGPASRSEVQFDYANMIRLNDNTEVRLSELEHQRYQIQIARGTVTFRVLRDSRSEVELSTPCVSVRPARRGEYRVTVLDDGSSEITVRSGEAEIFTPRGVERLSSGRTMRARGPASDPEFQVARAIPEDDWDRWNDRRDRDLERSRSYRYVSRDIYGAEDLDPYGSWIYVPPYGWVWAPNVDVGWAPYRYGRWSWIDWYGWSWVSYDPWGWAPYHYGRWFYHGRRWCWYPGAIHHRHYWRPGLVAFFGWGSHSGFHAGIGFGWGHLGWVPLAPYEPYYPWYGRRYYGSYRGGNYVDNSIHVVNNTNITNIYRNSRVDNAITAVNSGDFARGRATNLIRVSGGDLRSVGLVKGQVPMAPDRESLRVADREVSRAALARGGNNDARFFSRRQPATVDRVSFEDQRRGMEQLARRTFGENRGSGTVAGGARDAVSEGGRDAGVRGGVPGNSGWRRVGESGAGESRGTPVAGRAGESVRGSETGARPGESGSRRIGGTESRNSGSDAGSRSAETGARAGESGWRRFGDQNAAQPRGSGRDAGVRAAPDVQSRPGSSGESWRRFGERTAPQEAGRDSGARSRTVERNEMVSPAPSGSNRSGSTEGWRRFSEPRSSPPETGGSEGWRSFEGSRRSGDPRMNPGWSGRPSQPPARESSPGIDERRSGGSSSERLRINPPIVRERSEPRWEMRSEGGSFSGRTWEAQPRMDGGSGGFSRGRTSGVQPRYEAPSQGSYSRSGGWGGESRGGGSQPRYEAPSRGSYGGGEMRSGGSRSSGMVGGGSRSGGGSRGSEGRVSGRGR